MLLKKIILVCILVVIPNVSMGYLENDGWLSMELHHALSNNEEFSYRGNITISTLNSGLSSIVQEILSSNQRTQLLNLAKENDNYRLKVIVNYPSGVKNTFFTYTSACHFVLSQLNDILWVSIDHTGYVTAVTLTTTHPEYDICSKDLDINVEQLEEINTDLLIRHTELAPVPDTASFIQRMEREREARERGEGRDNRGFFAKYWMYIVPVVLILFISSATNPEQAK